jgi:hypothetical protein
MVAQCTSLQVLLAGVNSETTTGSGELNRSINTFLHTHVRACRVCMPGSGRVELCSCLFATSLEQLVVVADIACKFDARGIVGMHLKFIGSEMDDAVGVTDLQKCTGVRHAAPRTSVSNRAHDRPARYTEHAIVV